MLRLVCFTVLVAAAVCMTIPPAPGGSASSGQVLYDAKHHKAIIVMADGCYEYHMNHQDIQDASNATTKATLEARMFAELATAVNKQEVGHHSIDHLSQDIKTACAALPVFSWEIPKTN